MSLTRMLDNTLRLLQDAPELKRLDAALTAADLESGRSGARAHLDPDEYQGLAEKYKRLATTSMVRHACFCSTWITSA